MRDDVHVLDLADAHALALGYLEEGGSSAALNLGTGAGTSVREVVALLEKVSGRSVPVRHAGRRPGDPAALWADNRRAREVLGWAPRYGTEDILTTAWAWHLSHPRGTTARPSGGWRTP